MTAIGLVLLLAGWFGVKVFGSPSAYIHTLADYIGVSLFIIGTLLFGAGVFVHLWRAMP